jgi:hypothetical protein
VLKELGETEWAAWWGAVREVPDRRGGTYKLNGLPWHFSEDVPDPLTEPSLRGEHNAQVFAELGYTETEIREYTARGILVEHWSVIRASGTAGAVSMSHCEWNPLQQDATRRLTTRVSACCAAGL